MNCWGIRIYFTKSRFSLNGGTLFKGKVIPLQAWTGPEGSRRLRLPEFLDSRYIKAVRLSALRTRRLYLPRNIPGTHFC
jgi:hypothetical protein